MVFLSSKTERVNKKLIKSYFLVLLLSHSSSSSIPQILSDFNLGKAILMKMKMMMMMMMMMMMNYFLFQKTYHLPFLYS